MRGEDNAWSTRCRRLGRVQHAARGAGAPRQYIMEYEAPALAPTQHGHAGEVLEDRVVRRMCARNGILKEWAGGILEELASMK